MSRPALLFAFLGFLPPAACASEPAARRGEVDMAAASSSPVTADERARSGYSDKTILYYDPSHGNQVEYTSPEGRAFLWYPGNRISLPGDWRMDGERICFQYGENTFNPVTGDQDPGWRCTPVDEHNRYVVDSVSGDVFGLAAGSIPFRLPAQPAFGSISDVKAAARP